MSNQTKIKLIDFAIGILVLFLIVGLGSIGFYYFSLEKSKDSFDALKNQGLAKTENEDKTNPEITKENEKEKPYVDVAALALENPDTIAWIYIEGTQIDYPVMYRPDEKEYYLHRGFDGKYAFAGVPFVDESCLLFPRSDNLIVYGHHMKNGSMFANLTSYGKKDFYESHKQIKWYDMDGVKTYEVVAAFPVDASDEDAVKACMHTEFETEEAFEDFSSYIKKRTPYETEEIYYKEPLLTLVTCTYNIEDGRFLVIAVEK